MGAVYDDNSGRNGMGMMTDRHATPKVTHPLIRKAPEGPACACQREREDDVKWLAILIRRGLLTICKAIEVRYGVDDRRST